MLVNQKVASGGWFKIFTTNFNAGTSGKVIIRNDNTTVGQYVVADGIRFLGIGSAALVPAPVIEIVASDAAGGEFATNTARFAIVRSGDTNPAVTVNYSVSGTATPGVDYAALSGSVTLPTGVMATNILVTPLGNNLATNQVFVTAKLVSSANFSFTSLTNATVVIADRPVNVWLRANFTAAELSNASVSGDNANPDSDTAPNLLEYALGTLPKLAEANPFSPRASNGLFTVSYPLSKAAVDVALTPEWSTNLVPWLPGTNYFQVVSVIDQITNQIITIRTTTPAPSGFFRFRVSRL